MGEEHMISYNKFIQQDDEDKYNMLLECEAVIRLARNDINRLNNIINELEKWLNEKICLNKNDKEYINGIAFVGVNLQMYQMFLDKLQELKGDASNE